MTSSSSPAINRFNEKDHATTQSPRPVEGKHQPEYHPLIIGAGFNGVGNPRVGLLTLLFGLFAVGLPAAVYLQMSQGLNGVWLGLSLANLSGTIAAYGVYWWRFPKGG